MAVAVTVVTRVGPAAFIGTGTIGPIAAADLSNGASGEGAILLAEFPNLPPKTFAQLPVAPVAGMLAHIADSNTVVWGAAIAGGGSDPVLAWFSGTAWTVLGI